MFGTALNNTQLTHPLTSGMHNSSMHTLMKADNLNTWQTNISLVNIYHN